MYNLVRSLIKEIKSLCVSDIAELRYITSKEYINDRQVSIIITQEEFDEYSKNK